MESTVHLAAASSHSATLLWGLIASISVPYPFCSAVMHGNHALEISCLACGKLCTTQQPFPTINRSVFSRHRLSGPFNGSPYCVSTYHDQYKNSTGSVQDQHKNSTRTAQEQGQHMIGHSLILPTSCSGKTRLVHIMFSTTLIMHIIPLRTSTGVRYFLWQFVFYNTHRHFSANVCTRCFACRKKPAAPFETAGFEQIVNAILTF